MVLRRVSGDLVNTTTLANLAVSGNSSKLWMRFVGAQKPSIALPKDIVLRRGVLPVSGQFQFVQPLLTLRTAIHLPPGLGERDLADARTRHFIRLVITRSALQKTRHCGVAIGDG